MKIILMVGLLALAGCSNPERCALSLGGMGVHLLTTDLGAIADGVAGALTVDDCG